MMNEIMANQNWDSDKFVDQLISDYDDTVMPLPDIEFEPHLLISKVRKHYMEYVIQLLSVNYENNRRLINKNVYLPSAIWRCAKLIELKAAQSCMVVQLYRKNIVAVIKELKKDTQKGKLHKNLYDCLNRPPENDKKTQTIMDNTNNCNCQCDQRKKRQNSSRSPKILQNEKLVLNDMLNSYYDQFKTPVAINSQSEAPQDVPKDTFSSAEQVSQVPIASNIVNKINSSTPKANVRMSVESQDSDELMMQLEKLFQGDPNDDDLFEGAFCETVDSSTCDDNTKKINNDLSEIQNISINQDTLIENHTAQIKSLDERLATLTGLLVSNNEPNITQQKPENPKNHRSKWLCEEYYLKIRLFELLDQIGDTDRKELARIKELFVNLFGNDSDDEGMVSPLDETPEFIISCKERVAPWVVKLLTPYYSKGRIRGKSLFKALAKHLIRLIYQCSHYPQQYEVTSFVSDFLANHKMIRCEADFKQFRIDNI